MASGTWNLYLIAVDPMHQRKAIGAALLGFVEADLRANGQHMLLIETSALDSFAPTWAFYRARGYQEEARIRDFYQLHEDKIVFRKRLI